MKIQNTTHIVLLLVLGWLLYSCASIGRPEGGPRDEQPPLFVRSNPAPNSLRVTGNKIEIEFDEYIQLKDQTSKVVISPVQKEIPVIRSVGKRVVVEFRDSLKPETTYCIDFSDAIQDNNESNPLEDFAFAFSTGDSIDSLQISGMLLRARDLEPMQRTIVGLHSNLHDSAFSKVPFTRIARTNDYGQFTLRNLKPGSYRLYALNDVDADYKMARTEDIAFYDDIIVPYSRPYTSTDTVFTPKGDIDTIMPGVHTRFLPNDILLCMFNENYRSLYLKKNERVDDRRLHILFSAPTKQLPKIEIITPAKHSENWYALQRTANQDSLFYWITDTALMRADSIRAIVSYLATDSTEKITWRSDSLWFNKKIDRRKKKKKEGDEQVNPDSIPPLNINIKNTTVEVYEPLMFAFDVPLDSINQSAFRMQIKEDTTWVAINSALKMVPMDSCEILNYKIEHSWEPGAKYRIEIDSLAIRSVYGAVSPQVSKEFSVKSLDEYSNLYLNVNVQDSAFCELVNNSDAVQYTAPVINGVISLENLKPGTYFARLILDTNGNGVWDTGNFAEHRQPEEVFYFPQKINLKKNWDVEQNWDIYATAVNLQKPEAVKRNKPKDNKKKNRDRRDNEYDDEDEYNEFGTDFGNSYYTGDKYSDSRRDQQRARRGF